MSFFSTLLNDIGLGSATGSTQGNYSFTQQQKDFIKLQFKYGLELKQRLTAGTITQEYYDSHLWLTTQTLDAPYAGWWTEFSTAIQSEDLNWLAQQVGEDVASLTRYMGHAIGTIAGSAISGITGGLAQGFFGSLNVWGWIAITGMGVAIVYSYKKGYLQKALKLAV